MNIVKKAAILVVICIVSSLFTSTIKAQEKISLDLNMVEIENSIEIIESNNNVDVRESTIIETSNTNIPDTQIVEEDEKSNECEVVIIPSISGTIEIEEIIEYSNTSSESNI